MLVHWSWSVSCPFWKLVVFVWLGYQTFNSYLMLISHYHIITLYELLMLIIGHPNVGKSSLLNGLVGHKVCNFRFSCFLFLFTCTMWSFVILYFSSSTGCEHISHARSHQTLPDNISNNKCQAVWLSWIGIPFHCWKTTTGKIWWRFTWLL